MKKLFKHSKYRKRCVLLSMKELFRKHICKNALQSRDLKILLSEIWIQIILFAKQFQDRTNMIHVKMIWMIWNDIEQFRRKNCVWYSNEIFSFSSWNFTTFWITILRFRLTKMTNDETWFIFKCFLRKAKSTCFKEQKSWQFFFFFCVSQNLNRVNASFWFYKRISVIKIVFWSMSFDAQTNFSLLWSHWRY